MDEVTCCISRKAAAAACKLAALHDVPASHIGLYGILLVLAIVQAPLLCVQNKETILCPRCRRNLPISEYHVQPASFNGISTYCKICCSQNTLQMLKRRLPVYDVPAYKTCSRCLCELPSQSFYASTAARSGLHSQCKECYRLSQRERAARR